MGIGAPCVGICFPRFPLMRTEVTDAIGKSKGIPTWPLGIHHDGGEEGYGFQVHPHKVGW